jgi:hypothetical protein
MIRSAAAEMHHTLAGQTGFNWAFSPVNAEFPLINPLRCLASD